MITDIKPRQSIEEQFDELWHIIQEGEQDWPLSKTIKSIEVQYTPQIDVLERGKLDYVENGWYVFIPQEIEAMPF